MGNQCDRVAEKVVEKARGQQLADEFGIKFFETSAKSNINVTEVGVTVIILIINIITLII